MDIQAAIDALPVAGGIVNIPTGSHPGPALRMRDNIILQGQGMGTIIPAICGASERIYGCGLRDLIVDAAITTPSVPYTIDWRKMSQSHMMNVLARGSGYGLMLAYDAYYNTFTHSFFNGNAVGAELYSRANSNTFVGCKFSAPTGLSIIGSNGTTVLGGALESGFPNMVFKSISGDDGATRAKGVRQERPGVSSTVWDA